MSPRRASDVEDGPRYEPDGELTYGADHEPVPDAPTQCDRSCACAGAMSAAQCELSPGCDACVVTLGWAHLVFLDRARDIAYIHVHPGESLHDVVRRELDDQERPRWMN